MTALPTFSDPGIPLPEVEKPFGVLLDADVADWQDDSTLRRISVALLEAGCSWFVCYGKRSEEVHDRIDDFIVEKHYEGIVTTFHHDESVDDVLGLFLNGALLEMKGALVLVRDEAAWKAASNRVK